MIKITKVYHHLIFITLVSLRYFLIQEFQLRAVNLLILEKNNNDNVVNATAYVVVEANQSTSCRRRCDRRNSKILYTANNAAGLRDRQVVLTILSDLAGYLCAIVEFPPPTKMLARKHNRNTPSDPKIVWSDYWNLTFIDDAIPSVKTLPVIDQNRGSNDKYSKRRDEDYKDWYHVVTTTPESVYRDFEEIERVSWESSHPGFVWEIRASWYSEMRKVMKAGLKARNHSREEWKMIPPDKKYPNGPSCTYTKEEVPNHLQEIVDDVTNLIEIQSPKNTTFGYFHVRRGDVTSSCDTSLSRMKSYLQCTFQKHTEMGRSITILFLSDDMKKDFRIGMQRIVEELQPSGVVRFIDLDKLIWFRLREEAEEMKYLVDEYYLFKVSEVLKEQFGSFYLEQRRHIHCEDCDTLPLL